MLHNPYQLVIWDKSGNLIHKEHISSNVAQLSKKELTIFLNKYPNIKSIIDSRKFTFKNKIYVDYSILGMPNLIGSDAWGDLYDYDCPHPYSSNFSESVTNWVNWYNSDNPGIKILKDSKKKLIISIIDPKGKRFKSLISSLLFIIVRPA